MDVDEALRAYVEEKAGKLARFYDRVQSVDVVLDRQAGRHFCELIAHADHRNTFVAKEQHADAFASLDAAVKDVERQLSRHKERFRNRKHLVGREEQAPLGGAEPAAEPEA